MNGKFEVEVHTTNLDEIVDINRTLCTQPLFISKSGLTIHVDLLPGRIFPKQSMGVCDALENLRLMGPYQK